MLEKEHTPEMVGLREAARRSGLSYSGVRRLCLENRIVHIRIGTKYLVNWQKLCEYLDGGGKDTGLANEN